LASVEREIRSQHPRILRRYEQIRVRIGSRTDQEAARRPSQSRWRGWIAGTPERWRCVRVPAAEI